MLLSIIYALWAIFFGAITIFYFADEGEPIFCWFPTELYERTKMNVLGCIVSYILLLFINPIGCLGNLIYWITHVGRD